MFIYGSKFRFLSFSRVPVHYYCVNDVSLSFGIIKLVFKKGIVQKPRTFSFTVQLRRILCQTVRFAEATKCIFRLMHCFFGFAFDKMMVGAMLLLKLNKFIFFVLHEMFL